MGGQASSLAWYRFRATARRRWGAYLGLVLIIGLAGGAGLGALAAARRTASSYTTFLASTNPSDLSLNIDVGPDISTELSRLPGVAKVATSLFNLNAFPLSPSGHAVIPTALAEGEVSPIAGLAGEFFSQDKVTVTRGRMASPGRQDEFVTTALAARLLGWHLGEVVPMGFYLNSQAPSARPHLELNMKLTGFVIFNNEVVVDAVDRYPTFFLFSPALARAVDQGPQDFLYGLKLVDGAEGVPAVEREIITELPGGPGYTFHVTSVVQDQVNQSIEPETTALGVFGAIALLASLLVAGQAVGRQLAQNESEAAVLRALGAGPGAVVLDSLSGTMMAIVAGAALAVGVAVAVSPLSPLGPVRPVYPGRGPAVDLTVLGPGAALLVVCTGGVALALAARAIRSTRRQRATGDRALPSAMARLLARTGAPSPVLTGARFALEPGRGRTAVPVRSVLLANVLAVAIVTATFNFGSGLSTLVSHPRLYGWNWDYALQGYPVPPQSLSLLTKDPLVAAWSGVRFADVEIDGQTVPALISTPRARVSPPVLSGHALDAGGQVVLGGATLAALHERVGQRVSVSYGDRADAPYYVPPTSLVIVGTATLPTVGEPQALHTSMGTGAIIASSVEPLALRKALDQPVATLNGPSEVFVRLRAGASMVAGLASLRHIANVGTEAFEDLPAQYYDGQNVDVLSVQFPTQIENYRSSGAAPDLLAGSLALGAVVALGLSLVASVRRRRRDLALLKALGFTRAQLAWTVAWQSSIAVAIGVLAGVPAGTALGRWLWDLFARSIDAVPDAPVPALSLLLVVGAAFVLANAVATFPGAYAARTPAALVLRAE
ncbi:MAG: ABC transporter permease [Acidimicrobiales bacterium]